MSSFYRTDGTLEPTWRGTYHNPEVPTPSAPMIGSAAKVDERGFVTMTKMGEHLWVQPSQPSNPQQKAPVRSETIVHPTIGMSEPAHPRKFQFSHTETETVKPNPAVMPRPKQQPSVPQYQPMTVNMNIYPQVYASMPKAAMSMGMPQNTMGTYSTMGMPQNTMGMPQNTMGMPQNTMGMPQNTMGMPQNTMGMPQNTMGMSYPSMSMPQAMPKATTTYTNTSYSTSYSMPSVAPSRHYSHSTIHTHTKTHSVKVLDSSSSLSKGLSAFLTITALFAAFALIVATSAPIVVVLPPVVVIFSGGSCCYFTADWRYQSVYY